MEESIEYLPDNYLAMTEGIAITYYAMSKTEYGKTLDKASLFFATAFADMVDELLNEKSVLLVNIEAISVTSVYTEEQILLNRLVREGIPFDYIELTTFVIRLLALHIFVDTCAELSEYDLIEECVFKKAWRIYTRIKSTIDEGEFSLVYPAAANLAESIEQDEIIREIVAAFIAKEEKRKKSRK